MINIRLPPTANASKKKSARAFNHPRGPVTSPDDACPTTTHQNADGTGVTSRPAEYLTAEPPTC